MKVILGMIVLLASTTAMASCPDLSSTYVCDDGNGGQSYLDITQSVVNNVTVYQINGQDQPADGLAHSFSDSDGIGSVKMTCQNDLLNVVGAFEPTDKSYFESSDMMISRTQSGGLKQEGKVVFTADGQVDEQQVSMECAEVN